MSGDLFFLYLLTRLDIVIHSTVVMLIGSSCIAFFLGLFGWADNDSRNINLAQRAGTVAAIALAILIVVPSKQDMMFILASAGIIEAAQSETTKRIAGKSVEVFENYLDQMLKEDKK